MNMVTSITSLLPTGNIDIPKSVVSLMNLQPGVEFVIISDGESILLKPINKPDFGMYDTMMREAASWADSVGMKESDIDEAIKKVRQRGSK